MADRFFEPWVGKGYEQSRVLLLSESTYNWRDEDGATLTPEPTHPSGSIRWNIENFGKNRYFTLVNRALCMKAQPSAEMMQATWDECAYTIFVQEPVGLGAGTRPTEDHWRGASSSFLSLLEELRPLKVIVTGKSMWDVMPPCSVRLLNDLQAYRLSDGQLAWCLALAHPASRRSFRWDVVGETIRVFKSTSFPHTSEEAGLSAA